MLFNVWSLFRDTDRRIRREFSLWLGIDTAEHGISPVSRLT